MSLEFWQQPIDLLLYDLTVAFGWISISSVLFWGFAEMWKNYRQGIFASKLPYILLAINVPATTEQSPKALENMFATLQGAFSNLLWKEIWIVGKVQPVFSFEIASSEGRIQFYIRCQARFRDLVEAGIYAQYPEAEIAEVGDYTAFAPDSFPHDNYDTWGVEFVLKKDEYLPIRTFVDFEDKLTQELKDPLGQILEQMAQMKPGEHFWVQFCTQPSSNDWKDKGIKYINKIFGIEDPVKLGPLASAVHAVLAIPDEILTELTGISLLGDLPSAKEPDQWKAFRLTPTEKMIADGVLKKASKIGFLVKTRVVYLAEKKVYSKGTRVSTIKALLNVYNHLNMNAFGMYGPSIPKDDYFWQKWSYPAKQSKIVRAYKRRSWGMGANPKILDVEELATLWHFPTITTKTPLVEKAFARRGEPPVGLPITYAEYSLPTSAPAGKAPPPPPVGIPFADEDAGPIPGIAEHFVPPAESAPEAAELPRPPRPTASAAESAPPPEVPPNLPV